MAITSVQPDLHPFFQNDTRPTLAPSSVIHTPAGTDRLGISVSIFSSRTRLEGSTTRQGRRKVKATFLESAGAVVAAGLGEVAPRTSVRLAPFVR